MSIRLGYQIPNFFYGTPVSDLFPTVIAQAREAEDAEAGRNLDGRSGMSGAAVAATMAGPMSVNVVSNGCR